MNEKSKLNVEDVMSTNFLLLRGGATVAEAISEMTAANSRYVLVDKRSDNDEYGIVLTSDIAKHVLAKNRAPERVNVYEIMTKPVLSVDPKMRIRYCARLFEHFGISTAPVVENGKIKGTVTYDVLVLKGLAVEG
jgi:predicted transcriptional regulator